MYIIQKSIAIAVLLSKYANFHEEGRSNLLSIVVYAFVISAYRSGVRFVPWKKPDGFTVSSKVIGVTSIITDMST